MFLDALFKPSTSSSNKVNKAEIKKRKAAVLETLTGSDMGRINKDGSRKRTIEALKALAEGM
jgi:hypothetical protein